MQQIAVIGLGNFGYTLAQVLAEKECEVIAIDIQKDIVQDIKDKVAEAVVGDAADKATLAKLGLSKIDAAVVSLGDQIDKSVMATLFLKELGVKKILVKATNDDHAKALKAVGATEIIFPEKDEAIRLANSLTSSNILEYLQLSDDYSVVEIAASERFYKKTLLELALRKKYDIQVLAVRKPLDGALIILPAAEYQIAVDDILVVIGDNKSIEKFKKT